jgi:hypothetical protein
VQRYANPQAKTASQTAGESARETNEESAQQIVHANGTAAAVHLTE